MVMLRRTKQKEAILRVVRSTTRHPNANWIYDEVRREVPHISLGTVYRNLKQLGEEGLILEIKLDQALSRFDGNTRYHHHFVCDRCGRVFDVESDEQIERAMMEKISRGTDFEVTRHRCELYGVCKDCKS